MKSGIEQARLDLVKWEARVSEDKAALATVESQAAHIRERLAVAERCAKSVRDAVHFWDAVFKRTAP